MGKITAKHVGDMLFEVKVGEHTIQMDVPESMGGSDRAMTPPQVTIASLSGCIAAFVTNYLKNAGLDTTGLSVDTEFEKTEAPACLTNIKVKINVPNADIEARRSAILKVASGCPVHNTLCHTDAVTIEII